MDTQNPFDYIVVGAGSAGSVLANRLSEDPACRVLLVEAGHKADSFWISVPAGVGKLFYDPRYNWNYQTEPIQSLDGRQIHWPRGKVLGGSSSINGMVYMRGHPADFDNWEKLGNPGWAWSDVLPYFKRSECNERGEDEFHNANGPWRVSDPLIKHPSSLAFIEAASRNGIQPVQDLNSPPHEGIAFQQFNIANGRRQSLYDAFVKPVLHRRNLVVTTETTVLNVIFKERKAIGIRVVHRGQHLEVMAKREVILSAGTVSSPHLLMHSGIGPASQLNEFGIPVLVDSPGVGANLQDHWNAALTLRVRHDASYNHELLNFKKYLNGIRYLLTHSGYLGLGSSPLAAYIKSHPDLMQPDLQLVSRAMTFNIDPQKRLNVDSFPGISAVAVLLDPKSHGMLKLKSADPTVAPALHPNYLSHPEDQRRLVWGLRLLRKIIGTDPMASLVETEVSPGPDVSSDGQLTNHIRDSGGTSWHPVGTCKMGIDSMSVVDTQLRVRGVDQLRVVDASIMPKITSGNTCAPTVMIGEKAADMILKTSRSSAVHP